MRSHSYCDEGSSIIGAILIFFDNTAMMRMQEKMELSELRTRAIIDNSSSLLSLKDQMGRNILANTAFQNFFGLSEIGPLTNRWNYIFARYRF